MSNRDFNIIDRRLNQSGKSDSNRYRFLKRYENAIKQGVNKSLATKQITSKDGVAISIKKKDLVEWSFIPDHETGIWKGVNPGNVEYNQGDLVRKPEGGEGRGGGGSPDGDGEDEFVFNISNEEFQDYFFDQLALPDLVKNSLKNVEEFEKKRSGLASEGLPCNLDLVKSMTKSIGRELSFDDEHDDEIYELQQKLEQLISVHLKTDEQKTLLTKLRNRLEELNTLTDDSPSLDKMDLVYRTHKQVPIPNTSAVMFCLMDVSGSMGEHEKTLAKYYFMLLFLFLSKEYERVDIRFIRHHTTAKECDEEEFFHGRETGGTIVSTVFTSMKDIVKKDYSDAHWNIYAAQASDGDNWPEDDHVLSAIMTDTIMPMVQYFAYIEVTDPTWRNMSDDTSIWNTYLPIKKQYGNLDMAKVNKPEDIFPVFTEMFNKNRKERV